MTTSQRRQILSKQNVKFARRLIPGISPRLQSQLRDLTSTYGFSISAGDLLHLDGKWYVTHAGLLKLAARRHCTAILTEQVDQFSDHLAARWVFKATVFKGGSSREFVGFGDADPSNVSPMVRGAEMRVAETRAVNRALRKAYGIGLCSVEELGTSSPTLPARGEPFSEKHSFPVNGQVRTQQSRLRDQLCLAIRRFKLDPNLVKSYAADFCGTVSLSEASRESVQAFINHLNKAAEENRDALLCKLNSFAPRMEVQS